MASVRITEFESTVALVVGGVPCPAFPPLAHNICTIGSDPHGTGLSAAFHANTRLIRVQAEGVCCIDIGADPTATTSMLRMTAGQTEYIGVSGGHKLSCITTT